ncbi:AraC family transcriptional regulator [Lacisediminihabitans changchengi]|uniref:AraC family transcriptional regulator n=1 Tax=Lacisediminihabitans changchengi TaxID=2787634 RepID=A0A934SH94_9MICO|nr:AraC family transcriptional regulator [Lacisediminihabitans changchengi]MBK4346642.1 AraC family transcriptional regulator [Lacisediminihabitans changchengi]
MVRPTSFLGERVAVIPHPSIDSALQQPITRHLTVTMAGLFPEATGHWKDRPEGIPEAVILVCTAGTGAVVVDGARTRIGASTAILIPPSLPHSYGASDEAPWTIWWCHLRGLVVDDLIAEAGTAADRRILALRSPERVVAGIDEIVTLLEKDVSRARLIAASGAAWKLLTQIATERLLPLNGDPLQRAMEYLASRLDSRVQVPDLARLVGVSPSHLSGLFHRATGGGVLAHHTALRMARARQLLDSTSMTVAAIGADVGYTDPFYFSRHFQKMHGVSPTEYRSQRKG